MDAPVVNVTFINAITFSRGDKVDVKMKDNSPLGYTWLNAMVLGNNEERNLVAVRYDCLPDRKYDEWIDMTTESDRIATCNRYASPSNRPILDSSFDRKSIKFLNSQSPTTDGPAGSNNNSPLYNTNAIASNNPYGSLDIEMNRIRSDHRVSPYIGEGEGGGVTPLGSIGRNRSIPDLKKLGNHKPIFTIMIMIVNCLAFTYEMYIANWTFQPFSVNPLFGPSACNLISVGAKDVPLILKGQWWRLITPVFLHAGVIHLGFNLFSFFRMSSDLERDYGFFKVAVIYIFSGFFSIVTSGLFRPGTLTVGASGAIFGLLGSDWANLIQNWSLLEGKGCYFFSLLLTTLLNLAMGLLPLLDNFAHLGGLIGGFFLSLIFVIVPRTTVTGIPKKLKPGQWFLKIFSVIIVCIGSILMVGLLYSSFNPLQYCPKCNYISCIPNVYFTCSVPTSVNVKC